ncbi:hypothetical protein [Nitratireductor sp. OM-1]|uniref:hypothetical protein n=1 Tax=Nitratireductor sp. OM-1 TaxID=1756988 RepID=UPI000DDFE4D5|nr:hypothetical protein [Nitratireductor sp. OM-1]
MTDRPILFSGPMIRALLEGRKTQTRRILKPQPPADMGLVGVYAPALTAVFGYVTPDADFKVPLRYMPGDRLWVREAWKPIPKSRPGSYFVPGSPFYGLDTFYQADGNCPLWANGPWKPSIHMPRWASRLTLIVTEVRVERLQEITWQDAKAEGISGGYHQSEFASLWDSLNASRGFGWDANPWVVALTFNVIRQNIDAMGEAA